MSPDPPPDRLGTAARLLALAGALFLAFLLGAWTVWRDVFPFRDAVRDAFLGVQALLDERREEDYCAQYWNTENSRKIAYVKYHQIGKGRFLFNKCQNTEIKIDPVMDEFG